MIRSAVFCWYGSAAVSSAASQPSAAMTVGSVLPAFWQNTVGGHDTRRWLVAMVAVCWWPSPWREAESSTYREGTLSAICKGGVAEVGTTGPLVWRGSLAGRGTRIAAAEAQEKERSRKQIFPDENADEGRTREDGGGNSERQ
ncbi:hypothetical protein NDU88_007473 [Pleurodeles waltl]|uniref:Secreted protein n=1 Tax=Pleurodeles waltl TaxID=8319 RepID=A0AAV7PLD8_PLEWA|nr:hypothetical protein NDU88_007473 [Pleurodeles waltl]